MKDNAWWNVDLFNFLLISLSLFGISAKSDYHLVYYDYVGVGFGNGKRDRPGWKLGNLNFTLIERSAGYITVSHTTPRYISFYAVTSNHNLICWCLCSNDIKWKIKLHNARPCAYIGSIAREHRACFHIWIVYRLHAMWKWIWGIKVIEDEPSYPHIVKDVEKAEKARQSQKSNKNYVISFRNWATAAAQKQLCYITTIATKKQRVKMQMLVHIIFFSCLATSSCPFLLGYNIT